MSTYALDGAVTTETLLPLYQNASTKLNIAEHPLSNRAVEISLTEQSPLEQLDESHFSDLWETRYVAEKHLSDAGNTNRLCYAQLEADGSPTWQIAPYDSLPTYLDNPVFRKIYSIWKQGAVLFRTIFPASEPSGKALERVRAFWANLQTEFDVHEGDKNGHGALMSDEVIQKQIVYPDSKDEGEVLLLYNYAPLRTKGEQMHFLLIPNPTNPAENFLELDQEQYVQVLALAQKVADWAKEEFGDQVMVHFFDKTGKIAGQTQPVYHAHLILVNKEGNEETWGKVAMFFRMVFPARPLPPDELQRRVTNYRERVKAYLGRDE